MGDTEREGAALTDVIEADRGVQARPSRQARAVEKATPVEAERYDYRVTIRMTRGERAVVGRKAHESGLSVSRYLVHLATRGGDLRPEDRGRLRRLQAYFDAAAGRLKELSALPAFREIGGNRAGGQAAARLREVLTVLDSLSAEITRRLS